MSHSVMVSVPWYGSWCHDMSRGVIRVSMYGSKCRGVSDDVSCGVSHAVSRGASC